MRGLARVAAVAAEDRAEGTRRLVLDAAAEVFIESGYGNVAMSAVVERAGVSRGACYHHFPTKESLAAALIEYASTELEQKGSDAQSESASALENLIRSSFAQQNLVRRDLKVGIGAALAQAFGQITSVSEAGIPEWTAAYPRAIKQAIAEGDIDGDVDAEELGYVLWCAIFANNLLAESAGLSHTAGMAVIWKSNLRGIVPAESATYFKQLVQRVAAQYAPTQPPTDPE